MFDIVLKIFLWGKCLAVWDCIFFEFMLLFWFTKYWIWSGILFSSTRSTKCFTALAAEISNPNWYTRTVRIFKIRFSRCMLYRHNAAISTDWKLVSWDIHCIFIISRTSLFLFPFPSPSSLQIYNNGSHESKKDGGKEINSKVLA